MTVITLPLDKLPRPKIAQMPHSERYSVMRMAKRIKRDGLLNPLDVAKSGSKFAVIDGKIRLAALHALKMTKSLPRGLTRVPVEITQGNIIERDRPALVPEPELVRRILQAELDGQSPLAVAERFDVSIEYLLRIHTLDKLHPQILTYFNDGHLSLEQAAAFATLPNVDAQWRLLQELGPFAHAHEVIAAIIAGDTVIETADGNVHILPSREPGPAPSTFGCAA